MGNKLNKLGVENSLWNNIRAKKGSGKKPTPEMLDQEKEIEKESLDETTTTDSAGGQYSSKYFLDPNNLKGRKPIWKGGTIIQPNTEAHVNGVKAFKVVKGPLGETYLRELDSEVKHFDHEDFQKIYDALADDSGNVDYSEQKKMTQAMGFSEEDENELDYFLDSKKHGDNQNKGYDTFKSNYGSRLRESDDKETSENIIIDAIKNKTFSKLAGIYNRSDKKTKDFIISKGTELNGEVFSNRIKIVAKEALKENKDIYKKENEKMKVTKKELLDTVNENSINESKEDFLNNLLADKETDSEVPEADSDAIEEDEIDWTKGNKINQKDYTHYVVQIDSVDGNKICEGFEYKEDAIERAREIAKDQGVKSDPSIKVLTKNGCLKYGLNVDDDKSWADPKWYSEKSLKENESDFSLEGQDNGSFNDDLIDFKIPYWAASAIVNDDYTGLNDDDTTELDTFKQNLVSEYGNANLMLADDNELELGFLSSNDVNNMGSECIKMYLKPDKQSDTIDMDNMDEGIWGNVKDSIGNMFGDPMLGSDNPENIAAINKHMKKIVTNINIIQDLHELSPGSYMFKEGNYSIVTKDDESIEVNPLNHDAPIKFYGHGLDFSTLKELRNMLGNKINGSDELSETTGAMGSSGAFSGKLKEDEVEHNNDTNLLVKLMKIHREDKGKFDRLKSQVQSQSETSEDPKFKKILSTINQAENSVGYNNSKYGTDWTLDEMYTKYMNEELDDNQCFEMYSKMAMEGTYPTEECQRMAEALFEDGMLNEDGTINEDNVYGVDEGQVYAGISSMNSVKTDPNYRNLKGPAKASVDTQLKNGNTVSLGEDMDDDIPYGDDDMDEPYEMTISEPEREHSWNNDSEDFEPLSEIESEPIVEDTVESELHKFFDEKGMISKGIVSKLAHKYKLSIDQVMDTAYDIIAEKDMTPLSEGISLPSHVKNNLNKIHKENTSNEKGDRKDIAKKIKGSEPEGVQFVEAKAKQEKPQEEIDATKYDNKTSTDEIDSTISKGMEDLDYDIEPTEKFMDRFEDGINPPIKSKETKDQFGHVTKAQDYNNVSDSGLGAKMLKNIEAKKKVRQEMPRYNKELQPVINQKNTIKEGIGDMPYSSDTFDRGDRLGDDHEEFIALLNQLMNLDYKIETNKLIFNNGTSMYFNSIDDSSKMVDVKSNEGSKRYIISLDLWNQQVKPLFDKKQETSNDIIREGEDYIITRGEMVEINEEVEKMKKMFNYNPSKYVNSGKKMKRTPLKKK